MLYDFLLLGDAALRKVMRSLVLRMAFMAANPVPVHFMTLARGVQALPKIGILDGLFLGGLPAVRLPAA